jgi:hypothetical protein
VTGAEQNREERVVVLGKSPFLGIGKNDFPNIPGRMAPSALPLLFCRFDHLFGPFQVQFVAGPPVSEASTAKASAPEDKYVVTTGGDGLLNGFLTTQLAGSGAGTLSTEEQAAEPLFSVRPHTNGGRIMHLQACGARCITVGLDNRLLLHEQFTPTVACRQIGLLPGSITALSLGPGHVAYADDAGAVHVAPLPPSGSDAQISDWSRIALSDDCRICHLALAPSAPLFVCS